MNIALVTVVVLFGVHSTTEELQRSLDQIRHQDTGSVQVLVACIGGPETALLAGGLVDGEHIIAGSSFPVVFRRAFDRTRGKYLTLMVAGDYYLGDQVLRGQVALAEHYKMVSDVDVVVFPDQLVGAGTGSPVGRQRDILPLREGSGAFKLASMEVVVPFGALMASSCAASMNVWAGGATSEWSAVQGADAGDLHLEIWAMLSFVAGRVPLVFGAGALVTCLPFCRFDGDPIEQAKAALVRYWGPDRLDELLRAEEFGSSLLRFRDYCISRRGEFGSGIEPRGALG
ncbi:hypothetical protein [Luteococcus sanguinis]|uniref:Uncharacterized protein n=1 Tax=Luteococcus sanguinis TaxID=174038 RepID=A0ABW1X0Q9_9ACTN